MGVPDPRSHVENLLTFPCHHCGAPLRVPASHAGRPGSCPICREKVVSPDSAPFGGPARPLRAPVRKGGIPKTPGTPRLNPENATRRQEPSDELAEARFSSAWARRVPQRRERPVKPDPLFDGSSAFSRSPVLADPADPEDRLMAPEPDRSPPEAPDSSPADPAPRKEPATVGVADDALYRVGLRKPYLPDSARQRHRKTVAFTVAGTALVIALLYFRLVGWVTPWTLEETPAVLRALEGPPTKSGGSGGTLPGAPR